jgi:ribosomal protein S18 acetylase RimI-like enzyme
MHPRPYRDYGDFDKMRHILIEGRKASTGTYYVHVGDVNWWLFYPDQSAEFAQRIYLWEDRDDVLGWCLLTPAECALDVFVHPRLRGTAQAEQMFLWAEERLAAMVKAEGKDRLEVFWVFETDDWRAPFVESRGYTKKNADPHFMRSLADPIPSPTLPEGYGVRSSAGEQEAEARARASYGAFQSKWELDKYIQRRLSFMRSPVYEDERDMVVTAPDGRIAAFCIYWLDPVNKVGLFEPVGTHPDFQRQGLGKAVLLESLRRMKARGMETAIVSTNEGNAAAEKLYESVGFRRVNRLRLYTKPITDM